MAGLSHVVRGGLVLEEVWHVQLVPHMFYYEKWLSFRFDETLFEVFEKSFEDSSKFNNRSFVERLKFLKNLRSFKNILKLWKFEVFSKISINFWKIQTWCHETPPSMKLSIMLSDFCHLRRDSWFCFKLLKNFDFKKTFRHTLEEHSFMYF